MAGKSVNPPPQGDVDDSGGLLATTILVTVISVVLVALRFATRIWIVKRVGWDDWTILFACLGHPIGMALVVVQIYYGFGRPAYYLTEHQFLEFMKYSYGEWLQTFATLMFTKISICLFLLRITVSKSFIRPLQASIVILIVSNVVISLMWILQCRPHLDKAWNTKQPGTCFVKAELEHIILAQAVVSFVSDYFLSVFPILILRKVQISFRNKVGLCSLMGLGVVTGSLSVARTVLNWQNVTADPTYLVIPNWYIRTWEVIFGIVAACVPTLRPGYKWLMGELHTQYSRRKSSGRSGSGQTPLHPSKGAIQWTPPKPTAYMEPDEILAKGAWDSSDAESEKRSMQRDTVASTDMRLPIQRLDSDATILRPVPPPKEDPPHHPQQQPVPPDQPSVRRASPPQQPHPHIAMLQQNHPRHQPQPKPQPQHKHPHWYTHAYLQSQPQPHSQQYPHPHPQSQAQSHPQSHAPTHPQAHQPSHPHPRAEHHPNPNEHEQPHYPRDDGGRPRKEDKAMHIPGDLSTDNSRGMPLRPKQRDEEALVGGGCGDEELDYRI